MQTKQCPSCVPCTVLMQVPVPHRPFNSVAEGLAKFLASFLDPLLGMNRSLLGIVGVHGHHDGLGWAIGNNQSPFQSFRTSNFIIDFDELGRYRGADLVGRGSTKNRARLQ